ncbi:Chlamydia protease-like activity factor [Neochlamydia sp. TUME1]|uniref:protease-like activity factor CPAF n=1 Tax=Neochlamydia sp. TUME1 TaxID=1478174 RepID=UPI00057EB5D2|nr:protease-like activity factor CPAF [Neochlamydia sp. TUME1]KIC77220.1 Chlamydia protease-like activity factor [Neochlamydia sp. TUME1]
MINRIFLAVLYSFLLPYLGSTAVSSEIYRAKMLGNIDLIKSILASKYAPAEWKKNYIGWDLEAEAQAAKNEVLRRSSLSTRDYQKILLNFFNSMQDYHVKIDFYATEMSFLPFRLEGAEGRYFVAWLPKNSQSYAKIDPSLADMLANMQIGDEVLAFGNMPIDEYLKKFSLKSFGKALNATDQRLAEQYLTLRLASMGYEVEQGGVPITVRHHRSGRIDTYTPEWLYVPERITNHFSPANFYPTSFGRVHARKKGLDLFDKERITPLHRQMEIAKKSINKFKKENWGLEEDNSECDYIALGQYQSFVPELGEVLWRATSLHYYSYIFQTASNKKIGYLRIPIYTADENEYKELETIIQHFQNETDALVIDQLNNPGGSSAHLLFLLSLLSEYSLDLPLERITITQQDVAKALMIVNNPHNILNDLIDNGPSFLISPENTEGVTAFFQTILDEWNAGRTFTQPLHYCGITSVPPNPHTHYNKPILILVNSLDFSCADLFPAILQDNQRAKVFGSPTAGAGGFVLEHEYPNLFGIASFSYTGSIVYRAGDRPIENLGVTPDFPYEITVDDLMYNYKGYTKAVLQALEDLSN